MELFGKSEMQIQDLEVLPTLTEQVEQESDSARLFLAKANMYQVIYVKDHLILCVC